jgi:RNA-directed DNA polymerase
VSATKPFTISKHLVYAAFKAVKANAGAAGVDEQSIQDFEKDLKDNLYKVWNRMSSGSYFPPPVRAVAIPKKDGGERMLGIPTVADRVAQMVVKMTFEPSVEPSFLPDSYGYRPGKSALDAVGSRVSVAGSMTGFSSSISKVCLTTSTTSCYCGRSRSTPSRNG